MTLICKKPRRKCPVCKKHFLPSNPYQECCSKKCAGKLWYAKKIRDSQYKPRALFTLSKGLMQKWSES